MDPVTASIVAPAVVSGIGGAFGLIGQNNANAANEKINAQNIAFQRETNAKNESLMREQWGREDNAVQRRANDLQKAGISPLLAAGSAAGAGSVVAQTAPRSNQVVQQSGIGRALEMAINGLTAGMMTQKTLADIQYQQQQYDLGMKNIELGKTRNDISWNQLGIDQQRVHIENTVKLLENQIKMYDLEKAKSQNRGTSQSQSPIGQVARDVAEPVKVFLKGFNDTMPRTFTDEVVRRLKQGGRLPLDFKLDW